LDPIYLKNTTVVDVKNPIFLLEYWLFHLD